MSKTNGKPKKRRRRFGRCYPRPGGPRGSWLIQFVDPSGAKAPNGRSRYVTKSVASEAEGKALLKEIEKAILLGRYAPAESEPVDCDLSVLQAVDDYIASKEAEGRASRGVERYRTSRRAIALSPVAGRLVRDLQPRNIEGYMRWRKQRKWRGVRKPGARRTDPNVVILAKGEKPSNSSVNRDLALISAALNRLVRLELLERNVALKVKRGREPTKTRAILGKQECARLIGCADPHFRPLLMAALLTGQRPSELKALCWADVSFENSTISVYRAKVSRGGTIPMHPTLAQELREFKRRRSQSGGRKLRDDEPVFVSSKGRPHFDHRWAWNKTLRKAGLHRRKGLTLYSLRHSFATHYLERGSPSDLQQLLGHASYATTERYVRAVGERARAGIDALGFTGDVS